LPKYIYQCNECELVYKHSHGIYEKHNICLGCGEINVVHKVPTSFQISNTSSKKGERKPGEIVKSAIESAKVELKDDQKDLRGRTYEN